MDSWRSQTVGLRKRSGPRIFQAASSELDTTEGHNEVHSFGNEGKPNHNCEAHIETANAKEAAAAVEPTDDSSYDLKPPDGPCPSGLSVQARKPGIDNSRYPSSPKSFADNTNALTEACTKLRQPESRNGLRVNDRDIIGTLPPSLPESSDDAGLLIAGDTDLLATGDMPPPACYISYSYYGFLVISNLAAIPQQDFQFLELQGCLHVPNRPILDTFIRHYFQHMHPMLPILDEGVFWDVYAQRPLAKQTDAKVSLLLFQAMLFACCNVSRKGNLYALPIHGWRGLSD